MFSKKQKKVRRQFPAGNNTAQSFRGNAMEEEQAIQEAAVHPETVNSR